MKKKSDRNFIFGPILNWHLTGENMDLSLIKINFGTICHGEPNCEQKINLKNPRCIQCKANLTHFGTKPDISDLEKHKTTGIFHII